MPVSVALNAGIYNVCFGLRAGAAVVLMPRFSPDEFSQLVHRYQVRSTVLPPAAMVMLTEDPIISDLAPLRFVRSITAPLSPLAARRFMDRFGVTVLNSYGQAEIGEVIGWTAADAREHPEKLGALGRPHPGVDIRVVDERGDQVLPGSIGELFVRPPRMAVGYAGGASLDDRVDDQGFVRTGDHVHVDEDGYVWIDGRSTDLINRGGNKVFPEQVEEVLRLAPGVREAAVVAVARRTTRPGSRGGGRRRRQRRRFTRRLSRAPGALQGSSRLSSSRCAASKRGRQDPASTVGRRTFRFGRGRRAPTSLTSRPGCDLSLRLRPSVVSIVPAGLPTDL